MAITSPETTPCNPYRSTIVITTKQRGDPSDPMTEYYYELPEFGVKCEGYFISERQAREDAEQTRSTLSMFGEVYAKHCFPR